MSLLVLVFLKYSNIICVFGKERFLYLPVIDAPSLYRIKNEEGLNMKNNQKNQSNQKNSQGNNRNRSEKNKQSDRFRNEKNQNCDEKSDF